MDIKQRLFKIPELSIAGRLAGMDEPQLEQYVKKLNEFVDCFPDKEKELRACMDKKDSDSTANHVRDFSKLLSDIYADDLAEECAKHANNFKNLSFERINAYTAYLISTLTALSIDIQVATIVDESRRTMDSSSLAEPAPLSTNAVKVILAVDDDSFCLDMLKNAIHDVSCNVICSTNGGTALNMLRTHKPNLFVLDIDMPGMDGLELAEKIRNLGHKAPIVFITGNADKSYVLKAINAGGADFIVKPINPQNVLSRLKKFL
uniref:Response regulator receiver:metal-dependent phosphohydrolase n=1 Tax=uncultured bacterium contig00094 TaxID=1181565 RepID=A0A806KNT0_9BACT|nr:response regulator receiver:metal-dependent phosphohydrolase [uncultured bacterium contig00094]